LEPIDLRKEIITDQDIDLFIVNYPIKKEDVERICDNLEKGFPRKKFLIYRWQIQRFLEKKI